MCKKIGKIRSKNFSKISTKNRISDLIVSRKNPPTHPFCGKLGCGRAYVWGARIWFQNDPSLKKPRGKIIYCRHFLPIKTVKTVTFLAKFRPKNA